MHHAGGAEDRQAADDAEPRVPGVAGQLFAARNRDRDLDVAGRAMGGGDLGDRLAHHAAAAPGLIAGSPGGNRQPRLGDRADPRAGAEDDPGAGRQRAHRRRGSARHGSRRGRRRHP